jgi:hypothetical protein
MKMMKVYHKDNRNTWYDPYDRSWTLQTVDDEGNQVGECSYTVSRKEAMNWLETGE